MAAENDSSDRSIQMQFQSTEENGEISTFKLEDSLERAEMDISRFFSEATDGHPASPQKHLVYQPSRPNFEFLEGRSRSTLIYSRLQRPSTRDRKRKKRGRCENLSAFGWVFLSLALLQSKRDSCSPCPVALCKLRVELLNNGMTVRALVLAQCIGILLSFLGEPRCQVHVHVFHIQGM